MQVYIATGFSPQANVSHTKKYDFLTTIADGVDDGKKDEFASDGIAAST